MKKPSDRVLYWGFFQPFEFDTLEKTIKKVTGKKPFFTVSKSEGGRKPTWDIFDLIKFRIPAARPTEISTQLYDEFMKTHFLEFSVMYDRYTSSYSRFDITNHDKTHPSEYYNAIRYYIDLYTNAVVRKKMTTLVMINPPHQGIDLILSFVFEKLGLKTIFLYQTLIPNAFFCIEDRADFGVIDKMLTYEPYGDYQVEKKYEKSLFYMKTVKKTGKRSVKAKKPNRLKRFRQILSKSFTFRLRLLLQIFKPNSWAKFFDVLIEAIYFSSEKNMSKATTSYEYLLTKFNDTKGAYQKYISFEDNVPFIYVPLHYQPELTTSSIGGGYNDQLLMVEKLSFMLPKGWKIYVKENPKQGSYMRDELFFRRIEKIRSVVYLDHEIDTYDLMRECKLVATVTGTAGWEAITGGKPCVYFGTPWYREFPGAFEFHSEIDLKAISKTKIDHAKLQDKVNSFAQKCNKGIVIKPYLHLYASSYDFDENVEALTKTFKKILSSG